MAEVLDIPIDKTLCQRHKKKYSRLRCGCDSLSLPLICIRTSWNWAAQKSGQSLRKNIKYKIFSHNYLKIVLFFSAKVNSSTTIIVTFLATMKIEQKRLYENL